MFGVFFFVLSVLNVTGLCQVYVIHWVTVKSAAGTVGTLLLGLRL